MVIRNHDRARRACPNNATGVIHHCKMDVESDLFTMVAAIASDTQWKDDGAGGKIDDLRAIELDYATGILTLSVLGRGVVGAFARVRIGSCRAYSGG